MYMMDWLSVHTLPHHRTIPHLACKWPIPSVLLVHSWAVLTYCRYLWHQADTDRWSAFHVSTPCCSFCLFTVEPYWPNICQCSTLRDYANTDRCLISHVSDLFHLFCLFTVEPYWPNVCQHSTLRDYANTDHCLVSHVSDPFHPFCLFTVEPYWLIADIFDIKLTLIVASCHM
jgi:hypothetical protein